MRRGKYQKNMRRIPLLTWVLLGMAVLGMFTGGVMAYLSAATVGVENSFTVDTDYDPVIQEGFDGQQKKDVLVSVPMSGDDSQKYAVYVRAAVVVTWRRADATEPEDQEILLAKAPVPGTDYDLDWNNTDWFEQDGFYYHKAAVNPGMKTADLIEFCQPKVTRAGYVLNVEIMAQTIQALGTTDDGNTPAVTDAWGVQVKNGQLKPTSPTP